LLYLANAQFRLAIQGTFLRGGICLGKIYHDQEFIFGPGLVRAYELESGFANFARILIYPHLLKRFQSSSQTALSDYYTQGEDGIWFLDYLFGGFLDSHAYPDPAEPSALNMLEAHRHMIEKKLSQYKTNERVQQKYTWLGLYHNRTVERLIARFANGLSK